MTAELEQERLADLHAWLDERPRSKQSTLGWSGVGSDCHRQTWSVLHDVPKVNTGTRQLASMRGIAIHEFLDPFFTDRGWKVEIPVEFAGIPGSVDLYRDGVVEDIKTGQADKVRSLRLHGPSRAWRWQVQGYARALAEAGYDVHTVRIVAYSVDSSEEIAVWQEPYDPAVADEAVAHVEHLAEMEGPPLPAKDAMFCANWCPFYDPSGEVGCPSMSEGSSLPTIDDPAVASAVTDLRLARDDIKRATARKKAAEALLEDVRGTVDGFAVSQVNVSEAEVPDDEAIREFYLTFEPALPTRVKAGYSYVSVRKQRAS